MRKRILVSFLAWSIVSTCSLLLAQSEITKETRFQKNRKVNRGQGATILKSRTLEFDKKDFSLELSKSKTSKRIYLKLKEPLGKSVQAKLKKNGVTLGEYVADNTYIVELNENKLKNLKNMFSVSGFAETEYTDKLSERLYKKKFSSYAKEDNYAQLVVSFYEEVSYKDAVSWVNSIGGIVESKSFSRTHKLRISIHQANIQSLAELDVVKYVDEIAPPLQTHNIDAGRLSEVFWGNTGLFDETGYALTGADVKVAVKDGSYIYRHQDFGDRIEIIDNDSRLDTDSVKIAEQQHATHVSGTIGGALDLQNSIGGMAEEVIIYSYNYNYDGNPPVEETDYTVDYVNAVTMHSAFIINNSWGHVFTQENKDVLGDYTIWTEDIDDFIYDYYDNDALLTKSAGNDRSVFYADCDGYYTLDDLACTKNTVVVGSIGTDEADNETSTFSSCGPSDDGRLKPDVVADGYRLYSTVENNGYGYKYGTSMSCPVVTGICALIHQDYNDVYGEYPSADIVKALLCNFAKDLGKKGPDFAYGFGLVNAKKCIDAIDNQAHIITGIISEAGDYMEYQFTVGASESDNETATLVWIDPAANPAATNAIVNDLDISISGQSKGYSAFYFKDYDDAPQLNVFEPTVDPTQDAKLGVNRYDTVEQVLIEPDNTTGVIEAGEYSIRVSGFKVPILNQSFAIASSLPFNRFHFNNIKIKDRDGYWVSNTQGVFINNPELLLTFSDIDMDGFNPANMSIQYKYSSDGGDTWSANWQNVTGLYEDIDCTQSCSNPHKGIAYAKIAAINFAGTASGDNQIKFKLVYDTYTRYSREYMILNYNVYFVSTTGSDSDTGSQENPWLTIGHAIQNVQGTTDVPAIIKVQQGTYNENIILGNHVRLYGGYDANWITREIDDEANMTLIQGDSTTHVVAGSNGNADNVILDGFVIKGGKAQEGGGIYLNQTSPTIRNCIIKDNLVENALGDAKGGGIYAYVSYSKIENCVIESNIARVTVDGVYTCGGGVCFINSYVEIVNCVFELNEATTTYNSFARGGGIYMESDSSKIINTLIKSNEAYSLYAVGGGALGGGIFIDEGSTTKILGNIIILNDTAPYYFGGDGIFVFNAPSVDITNCTLYNNTQQGIWCYYVCCNITNTIIWNHSANDLYGVLSSTKITYCNIEDGNFNGTNGNISSNPQFVDASTGDFRIKNISPCIDAGNDDAPSLSLLERDFQNQERIFEFDNSGTESVDIGADEYVFGFASPGGLLMDNDGITLTWESLSGKVYYVEYTEDEPDNEATWTQVQLDNEGIIGLNQATSWTDDGTEIIPPYDNDSVIQRFYRVFFDN